MGLTTLVATRRLTRARATASESGGALAPRRRFDAASGLTVYIVLVLVVPSNLTIAGVAAYGRPSLLWGLFLLAWWALWRLQATGAMPNRPKQPVRFFYFCFVVVALVSFASALLRGQPLDQISPAISAMVRVASWGGVLMVAIDGLRTRAQIIRLVKLLVLVASFTATLGLAQFITGKSFLEWISGLPGFEFGTDDSVSSRGSFARAAGTATHPLEHVTVLVGILPLAIVSGVFGGFSKRDAKLSLAWWIPSVLIALSCFVSVSRSAIVGLAVAFLASLPALPRKHRWTILIGTVVAAAGVSVVVPGMLRTVIGLFTGAASDPSTQSRFNALERVPEFMSSSPLIGPGFGTFLPRYYIFDNQWVMLLVEVGILGVLAFSAFMITAVWSAVEASRRATDPETAALSRAAAASVIALGTAYAFFDALAFPMSAGLLFLGVGICAALRNLTWH